MRVKIEDGCGKIGILMVGCGINIL